MTPPSVMAVFMLMVMTRPCVDYHCFRCLCVLQLLHISAGPAIVSFYCVS